MHHFVQFHPQTATFQQRLGPCLRPPVPAGLDQGTARPGKPLPSPSVVESCRLCSFSSFPVSASNTSNSMASCNSNQWVGVPPVYYPVGSPSVLLTSCPTLKLWMTMRYIFVLCFKTIKISPSSKLLLKHLLLKTQRPLPLWTETNPHKRNIPP